MALAIRHYVGRVPKPGRPRSGSAAEQEGQRVQRLPPEVELALHAREMHRYGKHPYHRCGQPLRIDGVNLFGGRYEEHWFCTHCWESVYLPAES